MEQAPSLLTTEDVSSCHRPQVSTSDVARPSCVQCRERILPIRVNPLISGATSGMSERTFARLERFSELGLRGSVAVSAADCLMAPMQQVIRPVAQQGQPSDAVALRPKVVRIRP